MSVMCRKCGWNTLFSPASTPHIAHIVSAAMLLLAVNGNLLPPSAAGTAELMSNFEKIFDCLNSATF